jgi:IS30 family transposase
MGFENSLVGRDAIFPRCGEAVSMVRLGELMMILELHRQGVSITAIARRTGRDPKTLRKYRARRRGARL